MTTAVVIGEALLFAFGVFAGLSWPKIRSWVSAEAAKTSAEIRADIERKL